MTGSISILGMTSAEFVEAAAAHGRRRDDAIAAYRAVFRDGLENAPGIQVARGPVGRRLQEDETIKFTQQIDGGLETESVVIPARSRTGRPRSTLCVSSQVGCALGCAFCETAQMGLRTNLSAEQIVAQWRAARFELASEITNVVFMGMGEPMDNLDAVIQAVRVLTDRNGAGIAASRITISTVGRTAGIRRLAQFAATEGYRRLRLAVSINAPDDDVRSTIMPINRAEPMAKLMDAMLEWQRPSGARVLIEYVLIPGVNDAPEQASELCAWLEPLDCTVNVIPYNPRRDSPWPAPAEEAVDAFIETIAATGQLVAGGGRTGGR